MGISPEVIAVILRRFASDLYLELCIWILLKILATRPIASFKLYAV